MREYRSIQAESGTWPLLPHPGRTLAEAQAFDPAPAIAEVIAVTGDTRRLTHISAGLLAAVLAGTAALGAALLLRGHPLALGALGLLVPVLVAWLVTAGLVLWSEAPVTGALAELRRATGAPVDLAAPWAPLGLRPLADSDVTWDYVTPLIAAGRRRHERARFALSAAVLTTAAFLLWMVISLAMTSLG